LGKVAGLGRYLPKNVASGDMGDRIARYDALRLRAFTCSRDAE
jgi:hypothetical protein